jgi:UPF0271 protein
MRAIDLNADLGEGFGRWTIGGDETLLELVTSASVACGFHAGDPQVMLATARAAAALGVSVGAHPGYRDLVGFGRRDLSATPDQIHADVLYQVGALQACCRAAGTPLRYVKPHGALYNRAARDVAAADAVAAAVRDADPGLVLLGLAGSELVSAGHRAGLRVAAEAFIDRAYEADGTLAPRGLPGAVLTDPAVCAARAVRMVEERTVTARDGSELQVEADSLCAHGDGATAAALLRRVRDALTAAGIAIRPFA